MISKQIQNGFVKAVTEQMLDDFHYYGYNITQWDIEDVEDWGFDRVKLGGIYIYQDTLLTHLFLQNFVEIYNIVYDDIDSAISYLDCMQTAVDAYYSDRI